ncbi:MAG: TatD family hydrolase [Porphyromonas sp.]|nr:TatD family hydrolase [Porphyromonas sp.]
MRDRPFVDFHTHRKGCERYSGVPEGELLIIQSLFYGEEKAHPRADFVSLGLHPMQSGAQEYLDQIKTDKRMAMRQWHDAIEQSPKPVIAIGECGWDTRSDLTLLEQGEIVDFLLEVAQDASLPIIFHIVKGWHLLLALKKERPDSEIPWIVHGFRGNLALQDQLRSAGIYLSYHPLYPHVASEDLEHPLLLESDDSDVDVRDFYSAVAEKLNVPLSQLRERCYSDFQAQILYSLS